MVRPRTPSAREAADHDAVPWAALRAMAAATPSELRTLAAADPVAPADRAMPEAADLSELYAPLLCISPTAAVAHLGQSLDGRIATACGASHYVTGHQDILHNHRMRALFDAVLVGAGTVRHDDPRLTVRLCDGDNPVRVVVDTERRLDSGYRLFQDREADTLLLTAVDNAVDARHGAAEVMGVMRRGKGLCPKAIRGTLAARGLARLFIEGGGVTVSRFIEAGQLDRLQVTIAPLIIGSGRPGIVLPQVHSLSEGLRPAVRRFAFGVDMMFECNFNG